MENDKGMTFNGCNIIKGDANNCTFFLPGTQVVQVVAGTSVKEKPGSAPSPLPEELFTDEALKYWNRLIEAGFVLENYQRSKTTSRQQAMYIADCFADTIGLKAKWSTFEKLWQMSNLAQEKYRMQETGTPPPRHNDIDRIFSD